MEMEFLEKWDFGEIDAARGQMVNRHVTPRGQVWKWDFWENGFLGKCCQGPKYNRHVTPSGQVWKWEFFGKWDFGEIDAASGLMVNRHVTPRGQVYKLNFWKNGFLGKMMSPGA